MATAPAAAQTGGGDRVSGVAVQGNQRVEAETVRSYMAIAAGDPFNPELIDRSLKNLFATGLFADVKLRRDGDQLVVQVVENPVINRIAFEGNRKVKDETLTAEVQLKPRTVFTRTKVQQDVRRIQDLYARSGRFAATVEPKVIQLEQNRVDLVFEISEGPTTYIRAVNFVGNREYGDSRLREVLRTKEERWYRFFSQDDTYDPDRLTFDRELLRRFYLSRGYADFRVDSVVAELTADQSGFIITFTVSEGERYEFGDLTVTSKIPDLDPAELQALVEPGDGRWYDADEVEQTVETLTDAVGNRGYAFVDIRPRIDRKPEERKVDIAYEIDEGPRVFVERINISGNLRTQDNVIRREFRLVEGDAFNAAKLRRSRQRIRDLNFFENVEVTNAPSETAPDRTVVNVEVTEKSTGELSFGVGWSSSLGPLVEVGARERNLLGRGQSVRIAGTLAGKRSQLDLSFTEPYFLDRHIAAGIDLYALQRRLQDDSLYESEAIGGALRAGYQITEALREDWRYTLREDNVTDVDPRASLYIREQEGTSLMSSLSHTFTYDKRDSRIEPTEGWFARLNNEIAGLGGSERFFRTNVGGGQYFNLGDQWILAMTASAGYIFDLGKPIRINERYFLGGDSLRGFETAGVGPRDPNDPDNSALGGKWMYSGTVQMNFPLGLPQELGVTGKLFSDVGSVGQTELIAGRAVDYSSSPRVSIGTGITWRSPFGPLSLDLAVPVLKEDFDEVEYFHFNFGTRF